MIELTKDEVFILGGLSITGVLMNELDRAEPLIVLLQNYRPDNAAGFVAEALYFAAKNNIPTAIDVLEESGALEMDKNYEQAISLYLHLLSNTDRKQEAIEMAKAVLENGGMEQDHSIALVSDVAKLDAVGQA